MKFVTVMDMWLLILNLCLTGCIIYYGRRLIKAVEKAVNAENNAAREEREAIQSIIHAELETVKHQQSMIDPKTSEWMIIEDQRTLLKDIQAQILKRSK